MVHPLLTRRQIVLIALGIAALMFAMNPQLPQQTLSSVVNVVLPSAPPEFNLTQLVASAGQDAIAGDVFEGDWGVPSGGDFTASRDNGARQHSSYDLARSSENTTWGQPAYAPFAGRVQSVTDSGCGHGLRLSLEETPYDLVYCHLAERPAEGGAAAGQVIAKIGKSGAANYPGGSHLHIAGRRRSDNAPVRLATDVLKRAVGINKTDA